MEYTGIKKAMFEAFIAGNPEGADEYEFEQWFKTTPWGKYEELEIEEAGIQNNCLQLQWTTNNIGFGQTTFFMKEDKVIIDHEHMSKEFIQLVMDKFIEKYYSI